MNVRENQSNHFYYLASKSRYNTSIKIYSIIQLLMLSQIPLILARYKNLYSTKIVQNHQTQLAHCHFQTDLDTTDQLC